MVGQYDVVHVQLFACIVKDNDPTPLVSNLTRLLSTYLKAPALSLGKIFQERVEDEGLG